MGKGKKAASKGGGRGGRKDRDGSGGEDGAERFKHSHWTLPNLEARGLAVLGSEIHGHGLHAAVPAPKDSDMCLIKRAKGMNPTNIACYINHAVAFPTCIITKKRDGSLWLTADADVAADEELTIDYDQFASMAYIQTSAQLKLPGEGTPEYQRQHDLLRARYERKMGAT